jgi:hypothetical protein
MLIASLPWPRLEILQEMLEALEQVLSAGLARRLQHLGIRQREVGRRERIDELPREELHLARRLRVEALRLGDVRCTWSAVIRYDCLM